MAALAIEEYTAPSGLAIERLSVRGTIGTALVTPATHAGEWMMLSWVDEARVPDEHRAFVQGHVDRAAAMLGTGPIRVVWYDPSDGGPGSFPFQANRVGELPGGVTPPDEYGPNTIGLLAGMRGDRLVAAVAVHEVRHVFQRQLLARLLDETDCENDAGHFAARYLAEVD